MTAFERSLRYFLVGALLALSSFATAQQVYPSRLVRIIVAFPPGGSSDIYARILAKRSLTEFIAFARSKPGQLNFASSGQGGGSHLVAELFNAAAGIKSVHVPYKGAAPAQQAVVSGEAQYLFNNIGVSQPFVLAGKLRGFAVTGEKRSPALPDVPAIAEAGIQGLENAYTWLGLLGPPRLPPAVLSRLSTEVIRIMRLPDIDRRVLNDGYEVVASTPAQFTRDMQAEVATWSRVIREKGIKAE